jgi:TRAP-type C4-dicarboxylate transport system substrate-binding protein
MIMKSTRNALVCLVLLLGPIILPGAQTLKIGSIAPAGTPWDITLKEIAADWRSISGGRIDMKIYAGGIAGDEEAMIRKMKVGHLDGVVVTSIGLKLISTDLFIMSLPRLLKSIEEYEYLVPRIEDSYDRLMEDKGYKLITWTMAGWIHFFSTERVVVPSDLKDLKIGIIPGQEGMERIWKNLGYKVLPVSTIDWLSSLQGGMVQATFTSPLAAAAYQIFGVANHMLDFQISPLLGAFMLSERSWSRIPPGMRQELIQAAQKRVRPLYERSSELEEEAMEIMIENGLIVHRIDEPQRAEWETEMEKAYARGLGDEYSGELFEEILEHLEAFRTR